jgi:hypothetical protein
MDQAIGDGSEHYPLDQAGAATSDHQYVGVDLVGVVQKHPRRVTHVFDLDDLDIGQIELGNYGVEDLALGIGK